MLLVNEVEYGDRRLAVEICNILWSGESSIMFVVIILAVVYSKEQYIHATVW